MESLAFKSILIQNEKGDFTQFIGNKKVNKMISLFIKQNITKI